MMNKNEKLTPWKTLSKIATFQNRWLTLIGEKIRDDKGQELEYWRVEKEDGAIIITIQNGDLILPAPMYRPGVAQHTLDFCGGRIADGTDPQEAAKTIVKRELSLADTGSIVSLKPLNKTPWNIDSSFTNVKLYAFVAELSPDLDIPEDVIGLKVKASKTGVTELLKKLDCLQCRSVLLEYSHQVLNQK